MSNKQTHFVVGGLFSLFTSASRKAQRNEQLNIGEAALSFVAGGTAGILPDMIDPPTGPNHRSIGHSVVGCAGLSKVWEKTRDNPQLQPQQKDFAAAIIAGYLSHLFLDAQTPAGLPFFESKEVKTSYG